MHSRDGGIPDVSYQSGIMAMEGVAAAGGGGGRRLALQYKGCGGSVDGGKP